MSADCDYIPIEARSFAPHKIAAVSSAIAVAVDEMTKTFAREVSDPLGEDRDLFRERCDTDANVGHICCSRRSYISPDIADMAAALRRQALETAEPASLSLRPQLGHPQLDKG